MKGILFTICFIFLLEAAYSQQATRLISGIVKDLQTGEPLVGANIFCPETEKGCSSDVFGHFKLEVPVDQNIHLLASFVGYKQETITKKTDDNKIVQLLLEPGVDLSEISVSAVRPIEQRMEMGVVEIPVQQLKILPMFAEPDILKAIQLLPGVQSGSEGRSGLYVRGGTPDQNLFMLDGTSLYYVNHLGGFVSLFHPDIIKNVKLYKGAFPARYGGRLSSVIDLRMKDGNKKEHHGSWGVGLVSGDLCLEGPIIKDRTSYMVSLRRVWFDLLSRPITKIGFKNFSMGYNFYDFFGKISHEQDASNRFYLSLYGGDDRLGYNYRFRDNDVKGYSKYIWGNVLSTFRWNHSFSPRINSDFTLFYTRYRYKSDQNYKTPEIKGSNIYYTGVQDFGFKADFSHFVSDRYQLNYGTGISGNWFKPGQISYQENTEQLKTDTIIGNRNQSGALTTYLYLENEIKFSRQLSVNAGVRLTDFMVKGENYFFAEPRVLGMFSMNKYGTLKASYSRMTQPVHLLTYSGSNFPTDIWLPSSASVSPGVASQYSFGYAKTLGDGKFELSIEAYTKKMEKQIDVKGGVPLINTQQWEQNIETNGTGKAKGVELMLQKKQGKTSGWISYTLSKSERQFENINNGKPYPFKYDRRHDLSIVFCHQFSKKIDFSATWVYGSGYPTTLTNGKYQTLVQQGWRVKSPEQEQFNLNAEAYLYPGKNWLRMRDYHRLDLGINFNKQKGDKIRTWTIGVYNAYNRQNAVFYYFGHRDGNGRGPVVLFQQSGFPIIPTVKYSVKF